MEGHIILGNDASVWLPTKRPAPPPPPPARPQAEIDEEASIRTFEGHLLYHRAHYERAIRLGMEQAQRAAELAAFEVGSGTLLEKVENRPLEVLGDFVAYPLVDVEWARRIEAAMEHLDLPEPPAEERLATLPTRGVFAEAKLGHCNASEEIDNTRFWDWQASPIPHMAPEIAPIQGVTPQPQQAQGLQATSFPDSLVNIVNPPAAPDPTGLGAALTALTAANVFRDMSGRAEVADLLKKLSDNSVEIAKVAQEAMRPAANAGNQQGQGQQGQGQQGQGQQGQGQQGQGQQGGGDGTVGQVPSMPEPTPPKQTPEQKEAAQIDNTERKLDVAKKYLPPAQQKEVRKQATQELKKPDRVNKKFEISIYGYGNKSVVGQWKADFRQRNFAVGSAQDTVTNYDGRMVVNAANEFDDNRYALDFSGEVLAGFGINTRLSGNGMDVTIPREIFDAKDYYYVRLNALVDSFTVEVSNGTELMKETTAKLGGGGEYKDFKIEGGGEWKWGDTRSFGRKLEVKVSYYVGGFALPIAVT
ncbi:MAG: hypothetical protein E5Y56_29020 [Mesorhizobium sp.]|nr:MAG: hypothetical protein E5Y56_29020 [Mesorhizobium sp.]